VFYLDYCDQYDWCKLEDQKLYISKATIGIMNIDSPIKIIQPTEHPLNDNQCIKLQRIKIHENDILSQSEKEKLEQPYLNKCINAKLLRELLHSISQIYIDKGYITTKPYLHEQNIRDGILDISVVVGKVSNIINEETNSLDGRIATAFIGQKDMPLNLRNLETALEMMNRVPSYHSKFSIVPAQQRARSIVSIETQRKIPYRFSLGAIGEKQDYEDNPYLNADLSIDNPLNINDILTLRYNGSRVQSYYQSTSGAEIDYSFVVGSYIISYTWFEFQYSQAVLGLNDTYRSSGDTVGSNLKVSKMLHRNQNNKLEIALSIQYKNNKNYFSNELIDVSSYKTTLAQIDLIDTYFASWGQLRNMLSYYRGTNWLGAKNDAAMDSKEKLQFNKFSLDSNLLYNIPIGGLSVNTNAHIQYTKDLLYDNNKLRVGSYYTVRGYTASYYGNNGFYIRNNLSRPFYPQSSHDFLEIVSPFIGVDYGAVRCERNTPNSCGSLAGVAVGFKTEANNMDTEFTLSRGLKQVSTQDFQNLFRYSVTFKY
jgi:hemolysin activation/secretion protein